MTQPQVQCLVAAALVGGVTDGEAGAMTIVDGGVRGVQVCAPGERMQVGDTPLAGIPVGQRTVVMAHVG